MNRGKKSGGGAGSKAAEEDIPDEFRCKRSDGKQWRCNARAMENKTLCEKHYNQAKKRAAGASSNSSPKKKTKTNNNSHNHHINESSSLLVDSKSHMITRPSLLLEAEPRLKSSSRVHGNHKHVSDHKHAGHSAKVGRPAHFQNGSSSKDLMRSQFAYLHVSSSYIICKSKQRLICFNHYRILCLDLVTLDVLDLFYRANLAIKRPHCEMKC